MRHDRVVVVVALIAAIALVAVPGSLSSKDPTVRVTMDAARFSPLRADPVAWTTTSTPTPDPAYNSRDSLQPGSQLVEPARRTTAPTARPRGSQPAPKAGVVVIHQWHYDPNVSFYGPGFYGKRTACGVAYTTQVMGVAHRTLPCGTRIRFRNPANGRQATVRVIDRGPYVSGRQWDLSGGLCSYLRHCYTGPIEWRFAG